MIEEIRVRDQMREMAIAEGFSQPSENIPNSTQYHPADNTPFNNTTQSSIPILT